MKVLFIGGTGIISSACSELAVARGIDLYLLNRGRSFRPVAAGARMLHGDIRDKASAESALAGHTFDAVVDWIAFTPEQVQQDIALFGGRTGQYLFISSASAYQTPPHFLPVTESTPLHNPCWQYSRNKAACEALLLDVYRGQGFPMTVVRPSHTYDRTLLPFQDHYTTVGRMRAGKKVVVHGDGTSLWTMTHHADFAVGLVGLLGDKTHSMIFDNSKIRRVVPEFQPRIPFWQGAREIMAWYDADPARQVVEPYWDALQDKIIAAMEAAYPSK